MSIIRKVTWITGKIKNIVIWVKEAAFVNDEEELMRNTLREKIIVINNQIVCATKKKQLCRHLLLFYG